MTALENLLLCVATAIAIMHLIGPSAIWEIAKAIGQWLAVILVLFWVL